jgi:hypothetical protein
MMIKIDIWKNKCDGTPKILSQNTLSEEEVIEAISLYLLARGDIDLTGNYEIGVDSITR